MIKVLLLYGGLALGALGLVGGIWLHGYGAANAKCEAAALRAQLAAKETDRKAAQDAADAAHAARVESETAAEQAKERIADYEQALKDRPAGACALTDDDLRRVRGRSSGTRTR